MSTIFQVELNPKITKMEVPHLRESIGWGGREDDYPTLFERCHFYAGIRAPETAELVAFGYVCSMNLEHGYLEDIMVHPDYQGQGLGKKLLETLIEKSRQEGLEILTLSTDEATAGFYKSCGFDFEVSGVKYLT